MNFNTWGIQQLWPLGGNATDTMGDANGTNVGGMTYGAGLMGRALNCDFTATDRIELGAIDVNNTQAMSLSAWVKLNSKPPDGVPYRIVSKSFTGGTVDTYWQLSIAYNGAGVASARTRFNRNLPNEILGPTSLAIDTWYLITFTYDKINMELFVNTTSQGTVAYTSDILRDPNVDAAIGNTPGTNTVDLPFDGQISQVILWNKKLTTSDISDLYNSGAGLADPEMQFPSSNFLTQSIVTDQTTTEMGVNGNNAKAVTVWCRPNLVPNPAEGTVFHMGSEYNGGTYGLRQFNGGFDWRLQLWGAGVYDYDFSYGSSATWIHFVVTNDGTTTRVYADGTEVATRTIALNTGTDFTFCIGTRGGINEYFKGDIADVRVYNRNIDIKEAMTMYTARGRDNIINGLQGRWLTTSLPAASYGEIQPPPSLLGSWQSGTSHTATAGSNRLMVVGITATDLAPASTISSVTYGGQPLTELGYATVDNGAVQTAAMYFLTEAGIQAASGTTVAVNWNVTPIYVTTYTHAMFSNIYQEQPVINGLEQVESLSNSSAYNSYFNYINNLVVCTSSYGNPDLINIIAGNHSVGVTINSGTDSTMSSYIAPTPTQQDIVTHQGNLLVLQRWAGVVGVFDNIASYPLTNISEPGRSQVSRYRPRARPTELRA